MVKNPNSYHNPVSPSKHLFVYLKNTKEAQTVNNSLLFEVGEIQKKITTLPTLFPNEQLRSASKNMLNYLKTITPTSNIKKIEVSLSEDGKDLILRPLKKQRGLLKLPLQKDRFYITDQKGVKYIDDKHHPIYDSKRTESEGTMIPEKKHLVTMADVIQSVTKLTPLPHTVLSSGGHGSTTSSFFSLSAEALISQEEITETEQASDIESVDTVISDFNPFGYEPTHKKKMIDIQELDDIAFPNLETLDHEEGFELSENKTIIKGTMQEPQKSSQFKEIGQKTKSFYPNTKKALTLQQIFKQVTGDIDFSDSEADSIASEEAVIILPKTNSDIRRLSEKYEKNLEFAAFFSATKEAISGHANLEKNYTTFTLDEFIEITTFRIPGQILDDRVGIHIEAGNIDYLKKSPKYADQLFIKTAKLGDEFPDYTIYPPKGITSLEGSITVDKPTKLSKIVAQKSKEARQKNIKMRLKLATCQDYIVPNYDHDPIENITFRLELIESELRSFKYEYRDQLPDKIQRYLEESIKSIEEDSKKGKKDATQEEKAALHKRFKAQILRVKKLIDAQRVDPAKARRFLRYFDCNFTNVHCFFV